MRNKFTDLMNAGRFEATPIASSTPEQCPICRAYNNIWGIATDTHCACVDGHTFITGTFVGNPDKWTRLVSSPSIGGYTFASTGYWSLGMFLQQNHLCARRTVLNGQAAIELVSCEGEDCCREIACMSYKTSESRVPHPIRELGEVNECLRGCSSLYEATKRLNDSPKVHGNGWYVYEDTIIGLVGESGIILELNYDKGVKIENEELQKLLDAEGIGELFFRQYPRYFVLDSDDRRWRALLRKDDNNRVFVRSFDAMTPQQWFEEALAIIKSYS